MKRIFLANTPGVIFLMLVLPLFLVSFQGCGPAEEVPIEYGVTEDAPAEYAVPEETMPDEHLVAEEEPASFDFSEREIIGFIRVQGQIVDLQQRYEVKLAEATSIEQEQMINQQAAQEMLEAIQREGLTPETFNQIIIEVQENPELMEYIERLAIQEALQ